MTKEQARIIVLEQELQRAIDAVEFMHGCLMEPMDYSYEYPSITNRNLTTWRTLVPKRPKPCAHSHTKIGCTSCGERTKQLEERIRAEEVLDE